MKGLFTLLLGMTCCAVLPCEAKSHGKCADRMEKRYVDPQAVKVTEEGIFLLEEGNIIPVERVAKDNGGVFIEVRYVDGCGNCSYRYDWDRVARCPRCGVRN